MTRQAVKVEAGCIYWRGSTDHWSWLPERSAIELRDRFAADPEPYAQEFARQITAALNSQSMEKAA